MAKRRNVLGAAALVAKLKDIGWSRSRLEKELRLPSGVAYRWASGQVAPDISNALLLSRVLGIPIEIWADQERLTKAA